MPWGSGPQEAQIHRSLSMLTWSFDVVNLLGHWLFETVCILKNKNCLIPVWRFTTWVTPGTNSQPKKKVSICIVQGSICFDISDASRALGHWIFYNIFKKKMYSRWQLVPVGRDFPEFFSPFFLDRPEATPRFKAAYRPRPGYLLPKGVCVCVCVCVCVKIQTYVQFCRHIYTQMYTYICIWAPCTYTYTHMCPRPRFLQPKGLYGSVWVCMGL
jgi:hypothetical protein